MIDRVGSDQHDRAEADDEGQDVEVADEGGRPEHRLARFLGVADGEEAHQDVRQTGGAEHQRHAERDRRDRVGDRRAGQHDLVVLRMDLDRLGEQRVEVEAELREHQQRHQRRADQQQRRLDDLHPGGGDHAAEGDVDDHQHADQDDRVEIGQAEQQLDQLAGADHLRDQVEGDGDQRAGRRHGADRRRLQTIGGDVGEGEAAEVAQRLGHQEHDDRPADEEADRVDQAVVAGAEHQRRNAEERGRRHVVAGDRQAVLEAGDAAAGGVEVLRRAGALAPPSR